MNPRRRNERRYPPEVFEDHAEPETWRVETIFHGGEVSVATFSGPYAEREATDYHRWLGRRTGRPGGEPVPRYSSRRILRLVKSARWAPPAERGPTPPDGEG